MDAAGTEAAFDDASIEQQARAGLPRSGGASRRESRGHLVQRERAVGAGVAADEFEHWRGYGLQKRGGNPGRQRDAEGVAIAGCVFDGDQSLLVRDS